MSEQLYRLVSVNSGTKLDEAATNNMSLSNLRACVNKLCGQTGAFFMLKVPAEGKPVEQVFNTSEELAAAVLELLSVAAPGDADELFIYRGEKVEVGERLTVIPLSVDGVELERISGTALVPPEEAKPAEASAETPADTPPEG